MHACLTYKAAAFLGSIRCTFLIAGVDDEPASVFGRGLSATWMGFPKPVLFGGGTIELVFTCLGITPDLIDRPECRNISVLDW